MSDTTNTSAPTGQNANQRVAPLLAAIDLRDYFAAKAMHASMGLDPAGAATADEHAKWAYDMADAMLKARETP